MKPVAIEDVELCTWIPDITGKFTDEFIITSFCFVNESKMRKQSYESQDAFFIDEIFESKINYEQV